jgi:hypothetical protein
LPPDVQGARAGIDQMLAAFQFGGPLLDAPGAKDKEGHYRDQRLGFSYRPPHGDWRRKDLTPPGVGADMHMIGWTRTGQEIVVGALGINQQAPGAALKGMEARMRSMMGGELEREAAQLGGQRCQKARGRKGLSQMEMYVLERDGIAYMLLLSAPFIGHGSFFEDAAKGFAFLD